MLLLPHEIDERRVKVSARRTCVRTRPTRIVSHSVTRTNIPTVV